MIIICKRPGQLGNSIFLFAQFIAYSLEKNVEVINVSLLDYADYFDSTRDDVLLRFPRKKFFLKARWLRKPAYDFFYFVARVVHHARINNSFVKCIYLSGSESFAMIEKSNQAKLETGIVFIQGWLFRCTPYVMKHQNFIRDYFQPAEKHQHNVDRVISDSKKGCDMLIGLHIRHGDYAAFEGGKYFYSLEQYYSKMLQVSELFKGKKIRFLISSNGKQDYSIFKNMDCCFPSGHEIEDMYALAKCDYIMGPPSTYSMWASFYGKVPLYIMWDIKPPVTEKDFVLPEVWIYH